MSVYRKEAKLYDKIFMNETIDQIKELHIKMTIKKVDTH